MKKFYLSIIAILLLSILIFSGCDLFADDEDDVVVTAINVGNTLTLTGEITHIFVPPPTDTWTATYTSVGNDYVLINENDDSTLDTDSDGDADLSLSYGVPAAGMLVFPSVCNYTSQIPAQFVTC